MPRVDGYSFSRARPPSHKLQSPQMQKLGSSGGTPPITPQGTLDGVNACGGIGLMLSAASTSQGVEGEGVGPVLLRGRDSALDGLEALPSHR